MKFSGWMKQTQQLTGNVQTKPTVTYIKDEQGITQQALFPQGSTVI